MMITIVVVNVVASKACTAISRLRSASAFYCILLVSYDET
jgi:hypothetical protein